MLQELLYNVNITATSGNMERMVDAIHIDSRGVKQNSCFIAIEGTMADGHDYIEGAIAAGASVIICERMPSKLNEAITYVQVAGAAKAAGLMANQFYNEPSKQLKLVGVTGTNGKTTVATLLNNLYSHMGYKCGLISTVENKIGNEIIPSTHTTPDAISLNALLANMLSANCTHVFMECSSHAIHQHRLAGITFAGGLFTNISHDHLDYHKTFDEYISVKKSFFDALPAAAFAISNADDKRGSVMLQNTKAKKIYYSLHTLADYKGKILSNSLEGLHMLVNDTEVYAKMIGEFNAYNLLAVYGAAVCMGMDKYDALVALSTINGAEGRFDYQVSAREKVVGIVDYAHTPDALLNVLATIKKLRQGPEKIITVVGCGGNRDKTKRPIMAQVACEHSDKVIFTADNPRYEDAAEIIKDMEAGVNITSRKKYLTIPNRKDAIKAAVDFSTASDIVLIAGKGHEKYQEVNGVKSDFDDKKILMEMFELLEK